ncbi:MAG: family 43 glycosylhydrolase [Bacteroidales bacterium]|nr:family 43 glycosylhydrolase [Bacteroidales bacterium]
MKRIYLFLMVPFLFLCCSKVADTDGDHITIISWSGLKTNGPDEQLSWAFPLLKKSGIDCYAGAFWDTESLLKGLDIAKENGMTIIGGTPIHRTPPGVAPEEEIRVMVEEAVPKIKDHPALMAYYLRDEPETWYMSWLGDMVRRIAAIDPTRPCYINLYPNWAWNEEHYKENIQDFADKVPVPFISFDQYPVTEENGERHLRPTWYRNLEEIRDLSLREGKPFWAFALAAEHYLGPPSPPAYYPEPTMGDLRLQVFSDLVYGAQAIQYYHSGGIVDTTLKTTAPVAEKIKVVNAEIQNLAPVFKDATVLGVWHTGTEIPRGTTRMEALPDPMVKSLVADNGAVVSLIEKKGMRYLAIVNRSPDKPQEVSVSFNKKVKRFGTDSSVRKTKGESLNLDAGDILVYGWKPENNKGEYKVAADPLYVDPVFNGSTDPMVCYNPLTSSYYMYYTSRRANVPGLEPIESCHGSPIGIAESKDGGASWSYIGDAVIDYHPDENPTYWAPEVIWSGQEFHMFLSYVPGIFKDWWHPRDIVHLTSQDGINWHKQSVLALSDNRVIDACIFPLPEGGWRLWYNDENDGKSIYYADSQDLYDWEDKGKAYSIVVEGEGPNVFALNGRYYMIVDEWKGLSVFYSEDLENWTKQEGRYLIDGKDGQRRGNHADVEVVDGHAYMFYFSDVYENDPETGERLFKGNAVHVAELIPDELGSLHCDTSRPSLINLMADK